MIIDNMKWAVPRNPAICKIQNGRQRSTLKTQTNILIIFLNFHITFLLLATWGCATFLKMLPLLKFKMAARGQLHKIFVCAKTLKKTQKLFKTFPTLWRCAGFNEIQDSFHGSTSYFLWPK